MSDENPDWMDAALADLESRKAKIEAAIATIRELQAGGGGAPGPGGGPKGRIRPDSFLRMSIPDATKTYLEMERQKKSTQEIIDALALGGLPRSKYNTVYSILARREKQVGDIINMQGDWALKEWYPNYRPGKAKGGTENGTEKQEDEKAAG